MHRGAVFLTGANSGIGLATAERLQRAGFTVLSGVRRPDRLPDAVKDAIEIDLAEPDSVQRACTQVIDRAAGRLVGVVNNAGYIVSGPCEALDTDDWRAQFEVNFFGPISVARALLPTLLANKGRIVNVGSIGGRMTSPFIAPYNSSKFAMRSWTDSMRMELAPHGVHVSLIEPGSIDTPIWEKGNAIADEQLTKLTDEQQERYAVQIKGARAAADYIAEHSIPPDRVAKAIEHALTSPRPKGRYVVGIDARMQVAASMLPARATDRVMSTMLTRFGKD
jgi:NAD(P)-dependent dehydrogenase (short-subunit alcohol dehydrogenase family)